MKMCWDMIVVNTTAQMYEDGVTYNSFYASHIGWQTPNSWLKFSPYNFPLAS